MYTQAARARRRVGVIDDYCRIFEHNGFIARVDVNAWITLAQGRTE